MLYEESHVKHNNHNTNLFGSNYLKFVHINLSTFND